MKLKDVEIGKAFKFYNTAYTKLNEDGLCILNQYADGVNRNLKYHRFDYKSNDYKNSAIKKFLHSEKYQSKGLNISREDLRCIREITLLSEEDFLKYKKDIVSFSAYYWLRSASSSGPTFVHFVLNNRFLSYDFVYNTSYAVRPIVLFDQGIDVEVYVR